jgi:predicted metal-dependent hydrolase
MPQRIQLGNIVMDVVLKDIKNVHLSVYPPVGKVRISAPSRMKLDTIRLFAISKLGWIKQQQRKLREQDREPVRECKDRESHYLWGKRYLLEVIEKDAAPAVELRHRKMRLLVRPGSTEERKQDILDEWYREQLKTAVAPLIAKWEPLVRVKVNGFHVRTMKTLWGSCSPSRKTIRLNTELAKKPLDCLEYITVHEMVHLLEPTHNARFVKLMDKFMPNWQTYRDALNRLPVRHERWAY